MLAQNQRAVIKADIDNKFPQVCYHEQNLENIDQGKQHEKFCSNDIIKT